MINAEAPAAIRHHPATPPPGAEKTGSLYLRAAASAFDLVPRLVWPRERRGRKERSFGFLVLAL
ncbi:hypothetical protein GCM10010402_16790 [Actinomadura luteofluorescens]|uniref:hypothetical protein n=1 Tax=Actinomadura luteofluorescens TaxID=46163 RepID=UPI0021644A29|nr:hypothetical protein [Actinomadura glauciflava]